MYHDRPVTVMSQYSQCQPYKQKTPKKTQLWYATMPDAKTWTMTASTQINPAEWQRQHGDQRYHKDSQYCWVVYIVVYFSLSASNKPHKIVNNTLS